MAFANLGTRLGKERLVAEYRLWGWDAGGGALLGAAGRVHTPPRTPRELADLSVGLELVDVTPLHAALLAAVVANDGRLPEPLLVTGACGALGLREEPFPLSKGREVLEPPLARRLRRAMEAVAAYGTGAGLAPSGFPIAMKTGTAAEWGRGYHVNYIGMGPLPDPVVAFCVRVTNERSSPAVSRAAREVTSRLLAALAERRPALEPAARPNVETRSHSSPGQRSGRPAGGRPDAVPGVDESALAARLGAAAYAPRLQTLPGGLPCRRRLARVVQQGLPWAVRSFGSWWLTTSRVCS